MPSPFRNFGFLLKDIGHLYTKRYEERARSFGLTLVQCKALAHLARNEGVSQARLGELADIEPMAMVRLVDRMAGDGWIVREPDPLDRRAHRLRTTPKAEPVHAQIWAMADETRNEFLRDLAGAERRVLMDLLERVHGAALALPPLASAAPRKPAPRRAATSNP